MMMNIRLGTDNYPYSYMHYQRLKLQNNNHLCVSPFGKEILSHRHHLLVDDKHA